MSVPSGRSVRQSWSLWHHPSWYVPITSCVECCFSFLFSVIFLLIGFTKLWGQKYLLIFAELTKGYNLLFLGFWCVLLDVLTNQQRKSTNCMEALLYNFSNLRWNLIQVLFQVQELKNKMQSSGMPWPGDEGQQRWEQAWMAIKKVRMDHPWKKSITLSPKIHVLHILLKARQ